MSAHPSSARTATAVLVAAALGAIAVLVLATHFAWYLGATPAEKRRDAALEAPAGSCLTWRTAAGRDMREVSCARPHLFETAARVRLGDGERPPSDRAVQRVAARRCAKAADGYLRKPLDPEGKYSVGALLPSAAQWEDGNHAMDCGLRAAAPSGRLLPVSGSVRSADQSKVYPAGTCLALTPAGAAGDPQPCTSAHSFEILGTVDLSSVAGGRYPSESDQQRALVDRCQRVAERYTGGRDLGKLGLKLAWDTRSKRSWTAGSHKVNCKVGAPKPDRSGFAPVSGSVAARAKGGAAAAVAPGGPGR